MKIHKSMLNVFSKKDNKSLKIDARENECNRDKDV